MCAEALWTGLSAEGGEMIMVTCWKAIIGVTQRGTTVVTWGRAAGRWGVRALRSCEGYLEEKKRQQKTRM